MMMMGQGLLAKGKGIKVVTLAVSTSLGLSRILTLSLSLSLVRVSLIGHKPETWQMFHGELLAVKHLEPRRIQPFSHANFPCKRVPFPHAPR